jgi:hypothetical protein
VKVRSFKVHEKPSVTAWVEHVSALATDAVPNPITRAAKAKTCLIFIYLVSSVRSVVALR